MRNGVRHALGAGAGLLATPLVAAGLAYGHGQLRSAPDWLPLAALAGAALLVGVLSGSRLSPLASLLPGLALSGLAVAAAAGLDLTWLRASGAYLAGEQPPRYERLLHFGAPVAGCVLLAASAFPSRWRARPSAPEAPPPPQPEEETPVPPPLPKRIPSRY
ncbi:hypothetical protein AB0L44_08755 [Nonomuraea wenchangensis]|uniref:hypothetical protein n=1 Tax=Nonomuraea wenchangensis TaxID=568860 RepID=UPI003448B214